MITFAPFPIPVVVEGLGNAYVIYVKENNQWEDDEVLVALEDGGQWRHALTSQIKSWNNATYGIKKQQMDTAEMSIDDWLALSTVSIIVNADVSEFEENEIRTLSPKNATTINKLDKWDGILVAKTPVIGDLGINKQRELYRHNGKEWEIVN